MKSAEQPTQQQQGQLQRGWGARSAARQAGGSRQKAFKLPLKNKTLPTCTKGTDSKMHETWLAVHIHIHSYSCFTMGDAMVAAAASLNTSLLLLVGGVGEM